MMNTLFVVTTLSALSLFPSVALSQDAQGSSDKRTLKVMIVESFINKDAQDFGFDALYNNNLDPYLVAHKTTHGSPFEGSEIIAKSKPLHLPPGDHNKQTTALTVDVKRDGQAVMIRMREEGPFVDTDHYQDYLIVGYPDQLQKLEGCKSGKVFCIDATWSTAAAQIKTNYGTFQINVEMY